MAAPRTTQTPLRLVRPDDPVATPGRRGGGSQSAAAQRVTRENRAAAIARDDQRSVFAAHVARQLDGGRAAILPPDRRRHLLTIAQRLGLGAFDANLVIAIVQDAVREGDDPLNVAADQRLALVRAPRPEVESVRSLLLWWAGAMVLGLALLAGLISWTLH